MLKVKKEPVMDAIPFLTSLAIILAASIGVIMICSRVRLPTIAGLLITGIIIGPHGTGFIPYLKDAKIFADIGVVMLLFTIGFDFSLGRIREIWKPFFIGGALQVAMCVLSTVILLVPFGFEAKQAVFYGFLFSLSSTAVVLKSYSERNEVDSPHGKAAVGILLFQDLCVLPMMVIVPVLGGADGASVGEVMKSFAVGIIFTGLIFAVALYLMPALLHAIVRTRSREIFLFTSLFMCLGMALITGMLGLSLALGAFLAGLILSESEYSPQFVSEIAPFRNFFSSLFFISIGMLLNLSVVMNSQATAAFSTLFIFGLKVAILFVTMRALRYAARTSMLVALGLAQVGEFSFVLAGEGMRAGLMDESAYQIFLACSILLMMATPLIIGWSHRAGHAAGKLLDSGGKEPGKAGLTEKSGHVAIIGYGVNGNNLSSVLRESRIPYAILELNPETVRRSGKKGEPIIFGDATMKEPLEAIGIRKAKMAVFAISDPEATRMGLRLVKTMNPDLYTIVRTKYVREVDLLLGLGADEVIP